MSRRGNAFLIVLVLLAIAAGILGTFLAKRSAESVDSGEAIADAALVKVRRALWTYRAEDPAMWERIFREHSLLSLDPDAHWEDFQRTKKRRELPPSPNDAPLPGDPAYFLGGIRMCGNGAFFAIVRDNDDDGDPARDRDGRLLVYITAFLSDGGLCQFETLLQFDPGTSAMQVLGQRRLR